MMKSVISSTFFLMFCTPYPLLGITFPSFTITIARPGTAKGSHAPAEYNYPGCRLLEGLPEGNSMVAVWRKPRSISLFFFSYIGLFRASFWALSTIVLGPASCGLSCCVRDTVAGERRFLCSQVFTVQNQYRQEKNSTDQQGHRFLHLHKDN